MTKKKGKGFCGENNGPQKDSPGNEKKKKIDKRREATTGEKEYFREV